jgi:hypothetical protein
MITKHLHVQNVKAKIMMMQRLLTDYYSGNRSKPNSRLDGCHRSRRTQPIDSPSEDGIPCPDGVLNSEKLRRGTEFRPLIYWFGPTRASCNGEGEIRCSRRTAKCGMMSPKQAMFSSKSRSACGMMSPKQAMFSSKSRSACGMMSPKQAMFSSKSRSACGMMSPEQAMFSSQSRSACNTSIQPPGLN